MKKTLAKYGLFALILLLPTLAFASPMDFFQVPAGDKFKEIIIDPIWGALTGNNAAGSNPLGPLMAIFCSAIVGIAGVVVAYTLLAGTLATAHEGEVLGKRWSSMWIPIRISLGSAVMLPLPSGFCIMQVCVMWLAMQGIGLADKMWSTFASNPIDNAVYVMPDMSSQVRQIAGRMLELQACVYGYEQEQKLDQQKGGFGVGVFGLFTDDVTPKPTSNGQGVDYGPCGSTYQLTSAQIADNAGIDLSNTGKALTNGRQVAAGLWPIHAQQLRLMASDAKALAKTLGPTSQADVNKYLDFEASRYSTALNTALAGANQAAMNQDIREDMAKDGFLFAGAYYMQITTAQDQITQAVSAFPTVSVGSDAAQGIHGDAVHALNYASMFVENAQKANQTGLGADSNENSGLMAKVLTWFTQGKGFSMQSDATLNTNPIIRAKNLGNSMITYGWSVLGVGLGSGGLAGMLSGNIVGKLAGADTAFLGGITIVSPFVFALAFSLISTGFALAGYLPMVPYIIWMASMIGYCILLMEAIIAAPLWAFTHIVPDGDGVVGRGGQGYMLVLSLMIRPALMVMGLACSIVLMKPIGYVITSTFAAAYNLAVIQHSGWGGLTITIGGCILYFVILSATIHRIFSLIHAIPDNIMRWLGGGASHELGDHSTKMEGHSHHQNAAALGAVTGIGTSIASMGANLERGMEKRDANQRKATEEAWKQQQQATDAANDKKSRGEGQDRKEKGGTGAEATREAMDGDKDKPGQQGKGASATREALKGDPGQGKSKNPPDSKQGNNQDSTSPNDMNTGTGDQNGKPEGEQGGSEAPEKSVNDNPQEQTNPTAPTPGPNGAEATREGVDTGGAGMEAPTATKTQAQGSQANAQGSTNPALAPDRQVRDPEAKGGGTGTSAPREALLGQGGEQPAYDQKVTTPMESAAPQLTEQQPSAEGPKEDSQPSLPGLEPKAEAKPVLPDDGLRPMPEKKPREDD